MNANSPYFVANDARVGRRSFADDPHRPQYHFQPPAHWMNDPNGLIQWRGRMHMFYQYNPHGAYHGTIHWGHAVSDDLVHWEDLPVALAPTPDGHDAEGCWSGCAVDNAGTPTLLYTGVHPQVVCLATGSDDLTQWTKPGFNPVITGPPPELQDASGGHFRDPFVWRSSVASRWNMLMGCKAEGEGGRVLLYHSDNLVHWEYAGPLLVGDVTQTKPFWTGTMWECPNLLDFGRRQALLISAQATPNDFLYPFYVSGRFTDSGFEVEMQDILVHGGPVDYFYAPQVTRLDDQRYVLWAWLREGRSDQACIEAGWAGAMSLPLIVSMEADGRLCAEPAPELQQLRRDHQHWSDLNLADGADMLLAGAGGDSLEIIATFADLTDGEFGLILRASPDGQEYTRVMVQPAEQRVVIKRDLSSLDTTLDRDLCTAPVPSTSDQRVTLRVFLDRSIVEVFVNGGQSSVVSRIYPTRRDSLGLGLFSRGGAVQLKSLDVWRLESIW